MTGFVLDEQGDWFEDELAFSRRLVLPGWRCMDVGAAYGCYALSLAPRVGPDGEVIAVEPHPTLVDALRQSIGLAGRLGRIQLESCALASSEGEGVLTDPRDPEMATLSTDGVYEVRVTTVDGILAGKPPVDYLKVDIEGDGASVLTGAHRCLSSGRTIVQFVIRQNGLYQARSSECLMSHGYLLHRLVPGLGLLVPLLPGEGMDPFAINAFALPMDRMDELRTRGLVVGVIDITSKLPEGIKVQGVIDRLAESPWISRFCSAWGPNAIVPGWEHQRRAVAMMVVASDEAFSSDYRAACLAQSLFASRRALNAAMTGSRLATAVRIMCAQGMRSEACRALEAMQPIANASDSDIISAFGEPFLLPMAMHESLTFESLPDMVRCAILESTAFISTYSAYFHGASRLQNYERMAKLPVHSPRVDRVLSMLRAVNQRQAPIALRL